MGVKRYLLPAAMLSTLAFAAQAPTLPAPAPPPAIAAPKPTPAALAAVRPGLWHLKMVDSSEPERDICVADAHALMQIRHGNAACDSFVVADDPRAATISYTCPAAGGGRSTLRLVSPAELRIDSQGIADNAPFAFVAEAHRTGDCTATVAAAAK